MKKFLALLLSVLMLLTLTAAFAEEATPVTTQASFTKKYENAIPVGEMLTFKTEFVCNLDTKSTTAPATAVLPATIALEVTADGHTNGVFDVPFTVTAPEAFGTYIYKITEVAGTNKNETYDDGEMYIAVMYENNGALTVSLASKPELETAGLDVSDRTMDTDSDNKMDQFVNQYDVGSFEVTKTITGNAANMDDRFVVVVTFTSTENLAMLNMSYQLAVEDGEEATAQRIDITALTANTPVTMKIEIGHGEIIFFDHVPVGVTVSVEEINQVGKADLNFYEVEYVGNGITVAADSQTIQIINNKETDIPTGVELDSIPYIVLMAVAVLGAVAFIVKRRMAAADED